MTPFRSRGENQEFFMKIISLPCAKGGGALRRDGGIGFVGFHSTTPQSLTRQLPLHRGAFPGGKAYKKLSPGFPRESKLFSYC